jgi:hypothetical protein
MEIQQMWNTISGATRIVTKGLKIYLETVPGKHSVDCKKTAILGTCCIIVKVLQPGT